MRELKLEFFKNRGRGLTLLVLAMTAVSLLWIIWAFRNPDEEDIKWGWMQLMYNLPLLRAIIFPSLAAVLASKLSELEHKSGCLRILNTVRRPAVLYRAKFACGALYVLLSTVLELAVLLPMGLLYGFQGPPPMGDLGLVFLFELAAGLELFALSLALSMCIKNQAVPICIGVGGSFVGLMQLFMPKNPLHYLLPWAHTGALAFIGMDWSKAEGFKGMYRMETNWAAFAVTALGIALFYLIGRRRFSKMEV